MIRYIQLLLCLLAGSATGIAGAGQKHHHPEGGFDRIGKVEHVSMERGEVVINDMVYTLSDHVTLHSRSSESDSLGRLVKGTRVGFNFSREGGKRYIREIWLLPESYRPTAKSVKGLRRSLPPGALK